MSKQIEHFEGLLAGWRQDFETIRSSITSNAEFIEEDEDHDYTVEIYRTATGEKFGIYWFETGLPFISEIEE